MTALDQWQQLTHHGMLMRAWQHVCTRSDQAGADGLRPADWEDQAMDHLRALAQALVEGTWAPVPGVRVRLAADPERPIVLPALPDRVVQRALVEVLQPWYEARFLAGSRAYRPGISLASTRQAVEDALQARRRWALRTDIVKFFDHVDRSRLTALLRRDGIDGRVVEVIDRLLDAGCLDSGWLVDGGEGVPQGSALSPLLSNVYLHELDAAVDAGCPRVSYFRYADDMLVLAEDAAARDAALEVMHDQLARLGMRLHPDKTWVGHAAQGFVFLGQRHTPTSRTLSAAAWGALERSQEAAMDAGDTGRMVALLDDWESWYGALQPSDQPPLTMVAALALRAVDRMDTPMLDALVVHRLRRMDQGSRLSATLHGRLAEAWCQSEDAVGGPQAAVVDTMLAHHGGLPEDDRAELGRALGVPAEVVGWFNRLDASLADRLAQAGHHGLASAVRRLCGGALAEAKAPVEEEAVLRQVAPVGRFAWEHVSEAGHVTFHEVPRPPGPEDWARHVGGTQRMAIPMVNDEGLVPWACITIAAERTRALHGSVDRLEAPEDLRQQWVEACALAWDHTVEVWAAGRRLGLEPILEELHPGRRNLWLWFQRPVPLSAARAVLRRWLDEAPPAGEGLRAMPFPSHDVVRPGAQLWMVLPLGRWWRSKTPGVLRDMKGEAWPPGLAGLAQAPRLSLEQVRQVRAQAARPLEAPSGQGGGTPRAEQEPPASTPCWQKVWAGCGVVRRLVHKARGLGHLEWKERETLFLVLAHLPAQERTWAVRHAMGPVAGPEGSWSKRWKAAGPMPITCRQLRERHFPLAVAEGCATCLHCEGKQGVAPAPLWHALNPEDMPAVRARMEAVVRHVETSNAAHVAQLRQAAERKERGPAGEAPTVGAASPGSDAGAGPAPGTGNRVETVKTTGSGAGAEEPGKPAGPAPGTGNRVATVKTTGQPAAGDGAAAPSGLPQAGGWPVAGVPDAGGEMDGDAWWASVQEARRGLAWWREESRRRRDGLTAWLDAHAVEGRVELQVGVMRRESGPEGPRWVLVVDGED
jgi:group II intron reverse transcriptase/maturase